MPVTISLAITQEDYRAFEGLIREYVEWLRIRYQDQVWFVEKVLGHQSLDAGLKTLAIKYGMPHGKTLLAAKDGQVVGCCAYQVLPDGTCEMKRLFVPDRFRGHGTGRQLCEAIISLAKQDGFTLMRLDSGNLLTEAIAMYQSFGFRFCPPYRDYPADLLQYLVFMELPLI